VKRIVIIDYGLGNLRSVERGLLRAGAKVTISSQPGDIGSADGLVLPGVGAFRDGMRCLRSLEETIAGAASSNTPLLGICLGMQMLATESEEGGLCGGLDLIPGRAVRFPAGELKVPHMGWNTLSIKRRHPLLEGIPDGSFVYFVHSYHVSVGDEHVLATSDYGLEFAAVIGAGSVIGTQFHPEKSGDIGLAMLRNFVEMV